MIGRPVGSQTRFRYAAQAGSFPEVLHPEALCRTPRLQYLKMGFTTKCVKSYGLDNPFSTEDAKVIMIKTALLHQRMEIEVVIA